MLQLDQHADQDHPFIEWFGRAGYAAKGFVYATIGMLSLMQLMQARGGNVGGSNQALASLDRYAYGDIILWAVALGLIAYTLWRWAQGILDVENKGNDGEQIIKRIGLVISGGIYAVLAFTAIRLAQNVGSSTGSGQAEKASEVMSLPGGRWLIVAIGIGFALTGLFQAYRAYAHKYEKHWKSSLNGKTRTWATRVARFGIAARAVLFIVMSSYIVKAGLQSNPEEAKGLGGTIELFAHEPWMLGITAMGMICYALYCWTNAAYRRIPSSA